jgi:hypothetical protein
LLGTTHLSLSLAKPLLASRRLGTLFVGQQGHLLFLLRYVTQIHRRDAPEGFAFRFSFSCVT